MNMLAKIRFARAFLIAVKDPNRTEEILKATGDRRVMGAGNHEALLQSIAKCPKASEVLREKRLVSWNLAALRQMPDGSLGQKYLQHLKENHLDENFYSDLKPTSTLTDVDFVRLWIRKTHDLVHVLTGFDTSVEGEAGLQVFYYAQFKAKGAALLLAIALLHDLFYHPERLPKLFEEINRGWNLGSNMVNLLGESFDQHLGDDLDDYRKSLGVS